jgi:hypothetical protein
MLTNISLMVFGFIGLREAFKSGSSRYLKAIAVAFLAFSLIFTTVANAYSIDSGLYQNDHVEGAALYMVTTTSTNSSNIVTTHEGIWIPMMLGIDHLADEDYFIRNEAVANNSFPRINGTIFLVKRTMGEVPYSIGIYQKLYVYNEVGKDPKRRGFYYHKIFENDDVRILVAL